VTRLALSPRLLLRPLMAVVELSPMCIPPLSAAELWGYGRHVLLAHPESGHIHVARRLVFTDQRSHGEVCLQTRHWFRISETPAGGAS
jgi:hypothetical protein